MSDLDDLVSEARDALGRVNTNAFDHDLLFQYRGGILGRELTLIVRDLADALESVRAERDAAVAAIERVRDVAMKHRSVEQHNEMVPVTDIADLIREPSSADYLAALDGAPEPEEKP